MSSSDISQFKVTTWLIIFIVVPIAACWLIFTYCWPWMYEDPLNFWESLFLFVFAALVMGFSRHFRKKEQAKLRSLLIAEGIIVPQPLPQVKAKKEKTLEEKLADALDDIAELKEKRGEK